MTRQWTQEVMMQYPDKWIVVANLEYNEQEHKYYGEVHGVYDADIAAYAAKRELGRSAGKTMVIEGYNTSPQVGGLWA